MRLLSLAAALAVAAASSFAVAQTGGTTAAQRPNIVYIMSDDHAAHAISAYGSKVNKTPNIDRLAREGMRLTNCFATNALCAPSRATILTGQYSHLTNVRTHKDPPFDPAHMTYPHALQQAGYQTAVVGKWHLKSDPVGFDYWNILPGQGIYNDPIFIENGERKKVPGYATDIITSYCINWIEQRDPSRPFLLLCHNKAPHREWTPDKKHANLYTDPIPKPPTYDDDYSNRASAARNAKMRIADHLTSRDVKMLPPPDLKDAELKNWHYQRYMQDYLRCIASVDENVGRLLDYLDKAGLAKNTIVVYTSDQGFFLGDHGWYDKRFMFEESIRMPFIVRYPDHIEANSTADAFCINADFAPTFLDYAGATGTTMSKEIQGRSFRPILEGKTPPDWRKSFYYHYYEYPDADHLVYPHFGVRTDRHKLIRYYEAVDEWELFDLQKDPHEMRSVYGQPEYNQIRKDLTDELRRLRKLYGDTDGPEI